VGSGVVHRLLHFNEANLGFETSAPNRQPYIGSLWPAVIRHASLSNYLQYEAISYRWGSSAERIPISFNGRRMDINSISTVSVVWLILSLSALLAGKVARALSVAQRLKISKISPRWYWGGRRPQNFSIYSAYGGSTC